MTSVLFRTLSTCAAALFVSSVLVTTAGSVPMAF
jgi:hypothetical protein